MPTDAYNNKWAWQMEKIKRPGRPPKHDCPYPKGGCLCFPPEVAFMVRVPGSDNRCAKVEDYNAMTEQIERANAGAEVRYAPHDNYLPSGGDNGSPQLPEYTEQATPDESNVIWHPIPAQTPPMVPDYSAPGAQISNMPAEPPGIYKAYYTPETGVVYLPFPRETCNPGV
ncbi:MAG: hypothetical protein Q9202_001290 [Teloschistes flavicans]